MTTDFRINRISVSSSYPMSYSRASSKIVIIRKMVTPGSELTVRFSVLSLSAGGFIPRLFLGFVCYLSPATFCRT